jgi:hypothetical protein
MEHTDEQLLAMALANLGDYIHDNSPQYVLIEDDPRNEDDYDSWTYGMEVLPQDKAQQFAQRTLSQHIDPGALALDELLGGVGIRSNLSETLKYPTTHYVLEPGVYYKRQHKLPTGQPRMTQQSPGVIQEFIGFKDTPMMDWDVAGPYHAERNATIRHLGDVEDRIQNYLSQNPEATLRLYQSPGGYRAFDLTTRQSPTGYNQAFELLDVDPDYRIISQQRHTWQSDAIDVSPSEGA